MARLEEIRARLGAWERDALGLPMWSDVEWMLGEVSRLTRDNSVLIQYGTNRAEDVVAMKSRAEAAEAERDAALRAVADAFDVIRKFATAPGIDPLNDGAYWRVKHAAVVDAARKMGEG